MSAAASAAATVKSDDKKKEHVQRLCRYFINRVPCKNVKTHGACYYLHQLACPRTYNKCDKQCGKPREHHIAVCENYKYGECTYGRNCKYLHPRRYRKNKLTDEEETPTTVETVAVSSVTTSV